MKVLLRDMRIPFAGLAEFCASDVLLFVSSFAYLTPVNPLIGNCAIWLWLVIQCIGSGDSESRRYLWPLAALLLLSSRAICLHQMSHPFSLEDALVFGCFVVVASGWSSARFRSALTAMSLALIPAFVNIGSQPWAPNPHVGSNQGGYLLGIFFIFSFMRFAFDSSQHRFRLLWLLLSILAAVCIWQTDSRAAFASFALSLGVLLIHGTRNTFDFCIKLALPAIFSLVYWFIRFGLDPASGIPGMKFASDLGRLEIMKCYLLAPFRSIDAGFFGFGFSNQGQFCRQLIGGNPMDHSHNFFIQVWVGNGFFGLLAVVFIGCLFVRGWHQSQHTFDAFDSIFLKTIVIYIFFQALVDLSMLHWPLSICVTALCFSISLQQSPCSESLVSDSMNR